MIKTTKIHSITVKDRNDNKTNSHIIITVGGLLNKKEADTNNETVLQINKDVTRDGCFLVQTERPQPYIYGKGEIIEVTTENTEFLTTKS